MITIEENTNLKAQDPWLSITIKYHENISLSEFNNKLRAIEEDYNNYRGGVDGIDLAISKIEEGSIKITLRAVALAFGLGALKMISNEIVRETTRGYITHFRDWMTAVKNNPNEITRKINPTEPSTVKQTEVINSFVGDNNTINLITINSYNGESMDDIIKLTKQELNKGHNTISQALTKENLPKEEERRKEPELYESVKLSFETVSGVKARIFKAYVKSLDEDYKKVVFKQKELKETFNFLKNPVGHSYLVDIMVHYNPDNSIAKYEIIFNHDHDSEFDFNNNP